MKKYLKLMAFAMIAIFGLTLASCGDDDVDAFDDWLSSGKVEINGKSYKVYFPDAMYGGLVAEVLAFGITTDMDEDNAKLTGNFTFSAVFQDIFHEDQGKPLAKGMDLTKVIEFKMSSPYDLKALDNVEFFPVSGSAIVSDLKFAKKHSEDGYITIQFKDLKMYCEETEDTFTFNGKIKYDLTEMY